MVAHIELPRLIAGRKIAMRIGKAFDSNAIAMLLHIRFR